MKWFLDDSKRNRWGIWIDESHDHSQKVPSREVLSTVPRLRAGFISYRHLSAVAELPTKDVDS